MQCLRSTYLNKQSRIIPCASLSRLLMQPLSHRHLRTTSENAVKSVLGYHHDTKHAPKRYAKSMGDLDWDNQPNPFREFVGSPATDLLAHLPSGRKYPGFFGLDSVHTEPQAVSLSCISDFLFHSMALSAWKEYGKSKWSLRVNPSSGNLHPTEAYVILPPTQGLDGGGVFHYSSKHHALEQRCKYGKVEWDAINSDPNVLFYVGLSSVLWREVWKYGERAYRYCQHDIGHAMAALEYSAALQGWTLHSLDQQLTDKSLSQLLGLHRKSDFNVPEEEMEVPDVLLAVTARQKSLSSHLPVRVGGIETVAASEKLWSGAANPLSPSHHIWPIIKQVHHACEKTHIEPSSLSSSSPPSHTPLLTLTCGDVTANSIIRQRRSAVDMDGSTSISKESFFRMLAMTVPAISPLPWRSVSHWRSEVHLGIFVHRVDGLAPGLYMLVRDATQVESLQRLFSGVPKRFVWERVSDAPAALPLYRLATSADVTQQAMIVSCTQEIAGDGCFAVSMFARFRSLIEADPSNYRRLHWETGMVGHVLYLEAEAAGVRATGIGCFFDDLAASVFSMLDNEYQVLYNFTVGKPVDDPRLRTLAAYESHGKF